MGVFRVSGCLWVFMSYGYLRVSMNIYGVLWVFMGIYIENSKKRLKSHMCYKK